MCGIAGFSRGSRVHNPAAADEGIIRRMTSALTHRGPDQQDLHVASGAALGAVRLKVIDLDGGEQPVHDDDGQTTIVYNGEIYNFLEIRKELETRGHRFRSDCDTEVA